MSPHRVSAHQGVLGHPEHKMYTHGVTYGQVYSMARKLLALMKDQKGPVCVATSSRPLCAAALLASLCGGPDLVFPHGFSAPVLAEAQKSSGYTAIIGKDIQAPRGVKHVSSPWTMANNGASASLDIQRKDDEPFVHLFTGGSTGKPKMWTKTLAALLGEAEFMRKRFSVESSDVFLSTVPVHHIYGLLFSVLIPLVAGARVFEETAFMPAEIDKLLSSAHPSVFVSGPAHYRVLGRKILSAPGLRLALSSGSMLDEADGQRFFASTGVGVTEIYGSTETGGVATRCRQDGEEYWSPLSAVSCKLVDGRLAVSSSFLSLNMPVDEEGFFLTADSVQDAARGRFVLQGRMDGVVKVAGERVDLLDVEQKIRSLDDVLDAHVLSVPSATRGQEIVALLVTDTSTNEISRMLSGLLEPYALPRRFIRLDAIPRTDVGKPDRNAISKLVEDFSIFHRD